jgi:hypothetical protein
VPLLSLRKKLKELLMSRGDSIDLSVINPRREKSGLYKVILRNNQGQDERDINVNIMGRNSCHTGNPYSQSV